MRKERKILRGGDRRLNRYILGAGDAFQRRQHLLGQGWIVERDRILARDIHFGCGAGALRNGLGGEPNPAVHFVLHFRAEYTDRSFHPHFIGNDVVADAAMDASDRDDRWRFCDIKLPARDCLKSQDHL